MPRMETEHSGGSTGDTGGSNLQHKSPVLRSNATNRAMSASSPSHPMELIEKKHQALPTGTRTKGVGPRPTVS
ncbi:hypothetical protein ACOMHN_033353 [Nucella lapillus]